MKQETIKKTLIYNEMDDSLSTDWFSYTPKKFISHVDTLYYSVKTVGDWNESLSSRSFIQDLKSIREAAERDKEEKSFMEDAAVADLVVKPYFGFRMYRFGISKEDAFDIFVAERVPDSSTSTIIVQLRSQFIWLKGAKSAYEESLVSLKYILKKYAIDICDITENRIDFAYHTNYIQNMLSFFKDEFLGEMQVSSFKRWSKEGCFLGSGIDNDYISLGRRASNSSFIRVYNKSKEVIEQGYKQFFIPIWLENGLISNFDKYIFDLIFEEGRQSWNYKDVARCKFYLCYGLDDSIKNAIESLLSNSSSSSEDFKLLADSCVPDLTNIVNFEIQTKRKFYYNFIFPPIDYPSDLALFERRMYKVLYMLQSIRDFITYDTIRFVKYKGKYAGMRRDRRPTADWWLRLSSCGELDGISYDLCKDYQKKYDVQRCKSRSLTSIATLVSLLEENADFNLEDFSLVDDFFDVVSYMNDNDLHRYSFQRRKKQREFKTKFG